MQIPANQVKPGMTYLSHYGPRVVTSAGPERIYGKDWFVWRWERASRSNGIDCGYAGIATDAAGDELVSVAA